MEWIILVVIVGMVIVFTAIQPKQKSEASIEYPYLINQALQPEPSGAESDAPLCPSCERMIPTGDSIRVARLVGRINTHPH